MNGFIKRLLAFLAAVLIVLLVMRFWQATLEKQAAKRQAEYNYQLAAERQAADQLYSRLEALISLRDDLVAPQIELNIKL